MWTWNSFWPVFHISENSPKHIISFKLVKQSLSTKRSWQYHLEAETPHIYKKYIQFSSVAQSCPTLCNPKDCSTPGLPVHHQLLEFTQTHVHWVNDTINHLILCRPLLLLPSIFPSIRVFSTESVLHFRWPKYWSFSFSIGPSNEYSGLISFRIDWFDLLAVQGTLNSLLLHHN